MNKKRNKILLYIAIGTILFICLFPFIIMISTSFKTQAEAIAYPPTIIPDAFTLENYKNVFFSETSPWPKYFLNSTYIALMVAGISTTLAIFSGYALSRLNFLGKSTINNSFYVIYMFSGLLLLVPLYKIFFEMGIYSTRASLIIAMIVQTLPTAAFMMKSFFDSISYELEEAALIDGLSQFQVVLKIMIPLSFSGIVSCFVYSAMIAWNDYLFASTLLSDPDTYTVAVGLNAMFSRPDFVWGELMAAAILTSLPILIFYAVSQRLQKDDATEGGIK